MIARYGGCFEEDIMRLMYDIAYHAKDLDAPSNFAPTLKMRNGNARYKIWLVEVPRIEYSHLQMNSSTYYR